jgi:large subunit ribosomal protein L15
MMIHDITVKVGRHTTRKRIGRGHGSGHGKTSGRGHKGAGSRSGNSRRAYFEGGQMSWTRRIPKRGFTNSAFKKRYHVVNISLLEERVEDGADVNVEVLAHLGLVRDAMLPLKILGDGEITKKFNVTAAKLSRSAVVKIEAAGGSVTEVPLKKWTRAKKS